MPKPQASLSPSLLRALKRVQAGDPVTPQHFCLLRHRGYIRIIRPDGTPQMRPAVSPKGMAAIAAATLEART